MVECSHNRNAPSKFFFSIMSVSNKLLEDEFLLAINKRILAHSSDRRMKDDESKRDCKEEKRAYYKGKKRAQ